MIKSCISQTKLNLEQSMFLKYNILKTWLLMYVYTKDRFYFFGLKRLGIALSQAYKWVIVLPIESEILKIENSKILPLHLKTTWPALFLISNWSLVGRREEVTSYLQHHRTYDKANRNWAKGRNFLKKNYFVFFVGRHFLLISSVDQRSQ